MQEGIDAVIVDSVLAIRKGLTESESGPHVEDAPVAIDTNGTGRVDKLVGVVENGTAASSGC